MTDRVYMITVNDDTQPDTYAGLVAARAAAKRLKHYDNRRTIGIYDDNDHMCELWLSHMVAVSLGGSEHDTYEHWHIYDASDINSGGVLFGQSIPMGSVRRYRRLEGVAYAAHADNAFVGDFGGFASACEAVYLYTRDRAARARAEPPVLKARSVKTTLVDGDALIRDGQDLFVQTITLPMGQRPTGDYWRAVTGNSFDTLWVRAVYRFEIVNETETRE